MTRRGSIWKDVYPWRLAAWLGLEAAEGTLQRAVKEVRKEYQTFLVEVRDARDRDGRPCFQIGIILRPGNEWKNAWEEAWTCSRNPNPHCLSNNALRLYLWAKGPKNTGELTEQRKIEAQARLRRTYNDIVDHLREIRLKADRSIQWEKKGERWREKFRVWFEKKEIVFYHHGPLNPALGLDVSEIAYAELQRLRGWLYEEIMKPGFPQGTETVGIFAIRDRKVLKTAFSRLPDDCGRFGRLPDFFNALRLMGGMEIRHQFEDGGEGWLVVCQLEPGVTWRGIKEGLAAKAKEVPLDKRYTLTAESRALLRWILDLRADEYLLGMTPAVEDHLVRDIGLQTRLGEENVRPYVELLLEEINERTDFNLRTVGWLYYAKEQTRILVRKKRAGLEDIVHAVQVWGLAQNRLLDADAVRRAIGRLVGER